MVGPSPATARYDLMRRAGIETRVGDPMYIFIRKYTKVRSIADAARRAKSGICQILKNSHGFKSYYLLDGGEGVGVAVMIFEDRESANAANNKVLDFVQASLHDLHLGDPKIISGEVLLHIESEP
jgi:hypothetical protein